MNPKKPKYSVAAKKFWPLFVAYKGYPFEEMNRRAASMVGKTFTLYRTDSAQVPKEETVVLDSVYSIDCGGKLYTGKSQGEHDAKIEFYAHHVPLRPNGENICWIVDAAYLYESGADVEKEIKHNGEMFATNACEQYASAAHDLMWAEKHIAQLRKWEQFFAAHGFARPMTEAAQKDADRIEATIRFYKEGGAK